MSYFALVLKELRSLQSSLQATTDRLWSIKLERSSAYEEGLDEADFLPLRLDEREKEEQREFEKLISRLNHVILARLDSKLVAFTSIEDVEVVSRISKTVRYLHNAFCGEPPLGSTWTRLNQSLPSYSRN